MFTGININLGADNSTNAALNRLISARVGGSDRFYVQSNGAALFGSTLNVQGSISTNNNISMTSSTATISMYAASNPSTILSSDNISGNLSIRNGVNPTQLRIFNKTGTNTGEFGLFGWRNNELIVGPQQTTSGALRDLTLTGANININASGDFNIFDNTNIVGDLNVTGNILLSGKSVLTGIDLSSYATITNLNSTGNTLNTKIDNLSGYVNSTGSNIVFTTGNQTISGDKIFKNNIVIEQTGIFSAIDLSDTDSLLLSGIDIQIVSGSMTLTNMPTISGNPFITGNLALYATTINLASTGSNLQTQINNLDNVYATDASVTTVANNLALTGSALATNLASTGSTLNIRINNLSGYVNSSSSNIVFTTGDQIISGNKTFKNNLVIEQTGIFNAIDLSDADSILLSGVDIQIVSGSITLTNPPTISGNPLITGNLSLYATTVNLASTGNTLNTSINSLSGTLTSNYATITNLASTGSTLVSSINSLSGTLTGNYVTKSNGQFTNRPTVNGTGVLLSGEAANLPDTIVYTTGDQTISGIKTFDVFPIVSGNKLITGVDLSSYATTSNLALTGLNLSNNINSLSGLFTGYTGRLDATFATDLELYTTGSTLDNKINSLSDVAVLTYGDQTISGVKTFTEISCLKNATLSGDVINKKYADENLVKYIDNTLSFNTNLDLSFPTGLSGIKKINYTLRQPNGFTWGVNYNNITWLTSAPPNPTTSSPVVFEYYPSAPNSTQSYGIYINAIADLEKNRSSIVYTTGDQTINGLKTFNSGIDIYSGINPQSIRVFNSTGTNSGEFGLFGWQNNNLIIGPQQTSSGILRDLTLTGNNININGSGAFNVFNNTNVSGNLRIDGNINVSGNNILIAPVNYILITGNQTSIVNGTKYLVDTRSGSFGFNLPPSPSTGNYLEFFDPFYTWSGNNFILSGNGSNIEGENAPFTGNIEGQSIKSVFVGGSFGWRIV